MSVLVMSVIVKSVLVQWPRIDVYL